MIRHGKKHTVKTIEASGFPVREVRPNYWLADIQVGGARTRKAFSDLRKAKAYCQFRRMELEKSGSDSMLPERVRADLREALELLNGRASIVECAKFWLSKNPDGTSELWRDTAGRYLSAMVEGGRRDTSVHDKRIKLAVLGEALGNPATAIVDRADIESAVSALAQDRHWTTRTQHAYSKAGLTLVRFYKGEGRAMHISDDTPPTTWPADFIDKLLHTAEKETPSIVAGLAVMVFAGIRPHETMRLNWSAIKLNESLISLTGEVTKTRATRHIEISDNLKAWLEVHHGEGLLIPSPWIYRRECAKLKKTIRLASWPNDVLRHTAATMMYARTRSIDHTCSQLGHTGGANMFLKHYKGLAPHPDSVTAFWSIVPQSVV